MFNACRQRTYANKSVKGWPPWRIAEYMKSMQKIGKVRWKNEWINSTATNADLVQDPTMEPSIMDVSRREWRRIDSA